MSYDVKCLTLAEQFLSDELPRDHPRRAEMADRLAQQIQTTIEDFIQYDEVFATVPR